MDIWILLAKNYLLLTIIAIILLIITTIYVMNIDKNKVRAPETLKTIKFDPMHYDKKIETTTLKEPQPEVLEIGNQNNKE